MLDEREFSSALDSMKREGNVVSRIIRDAWDDPLVLRTLTKHSPLKVTKPFLSIVGHITIDELRQKLDQNSAANGFGNRFLFGCVERSKLLPHGGALDPAEVERLGAATRERLEAAQKGERIAMAAEAAQLWEEVYPRVSEGRAGLLGSLTARAEAQTVRLALIYALIDGAAAIEATHLEAALALWAYCDSSALYIFREFSGNPQADAIARALRGAGAAGMSRTDIHRLFHSHATAGAINSALGRLTSAGRARSVKQPGAGGHWKEMWFIVERAA
jgi:hypothetical protein